tara:strand:+ start:101 stop:682 length:582 start_codon:yes stop_codon:yes gene_type:complete
MAKMNITAQQFKSSPVLGSITKVLDTLNINNTPVNRATNPQANLIMRVSELMRSNLSIEPTETKNLDDLSHRIFTSMGCSVIRKGPMVDSKYSLLQDQVDTETVENPNKIDLTQFGKIEKSIFDITDVFKNENDSIFQLDEELPSSYSQQIGIVDVTTQQASPDSPLVDIIEKAINLNLNTQGVGTLPAFQGI